MARKNIGIPLDRVNRNNHNDNYKELYGVVNNLVDTITDEVYEQIIDGAKLNWKSPVDSENDLPTSANEGDTVMTRDDGKVYRYDGSQWQEIQQIDAGPVNEVDSRLSSQLAEEEKQRHYESLINRKEPGLMVSWIDDDGFVEVYDRMLPLMEEYNVPLSSALITKRVGTDDSKYLNIGQVKELQSKGMEFLSHTHNHDPSYRPIEMTEEELDVDFRTTKKFMRDNNLNHQGLVLPFAQTNDTVRKVSKRYFDYVFGGKYEAWNVLYPGKMDNYTLDRVSVEYGFEEVKERLDEAKNNGIGWVILISHIYNDWYSDEYCRQIIEYAQSSGFEFVSPSEGFNRMGNVAQFDDTNNSIGTTIGSDGSINSDKLGRVQYKKAENDEVFNRPLTDYASDARTFTEISNPNATHFPRGMSGNLETVRYESASAYSYQEFIISRELHKFIRSWDNQDDSWRDFVQSDIIRYLGTNALAHDENPLGRDVRYHVSCTHITNANSNINAFPEGKSGFYVINSLRTTDSNPDREYHIYRSNKIYRSYWDHVQGEWSDWVLTYVAHTKPINSYNENTRIDDYEIGITTELVNSNGYSGDLPGTAGTINTIKHSSDTAALNYQELVLYQTADKFMRNATNNGWSRWKKFLWEYAEQD